MIYGSAVYDRRGRDTLDNFPPTRTRRSSFDCRPCVLGGKKNFKKLSKRSHPNSRKFANNCTPPTIHVVWYIYLYVWLISMINVVKYTMTMDVMGSITFKRSLCSRPIVIVLNQFTTTFAAASTTFTRTARSSGSLKSPFL